MNRSAKNRVYKGKWMSVNYCPIVATLGYILSPDRKRVLLVHRVGRKEDEQYGKYNGLGGHMEKDEDVAHCMTREIKEEAGIKITSMQLRGTINWTGFGKNYDSWLAFVFLIDGFTGTPFTENEEGPLTWHRLDELDSVPMYAGDRYFLPLVFDLDPHIFHAYIPYDNETPLGWHYTRI